MNEEKLKTKFKELMEEGFQEIPSFEEMTPSRRAGKSAFLPTLLRYAAAILLLGGLSLWILNQRTSQSSSANLMQWEAPTAPLVVPIETETKLYTWQSPTDFLMPQN